MRVTARAVIARTVAAAAVTASGLTAIAGCSSDPGASPSASTGPASAGPTLPSPNPTTPSPGPSSSSPASSSSASPASPRPGAIPKPALADGRHPARITAVSTGARTVTIDVVQFFTGAAAVAAAAADGSTELPPPNDYWIRNVSAQLRTLPVARNAVITVNVLSAAETGSATKDVAVTLAKLASYDGLARQLFWVTARNGTVLTLTEQFLP